MARRKAAEQEEIRQKPDPADWQDTGEATPEERAAVPTQRPMYVTRQTEREASAPSTEMPREQKRGLLARWRFGAEINDHDLTMMRGTHIVIEGQAHAEGAAVTAIRGVQLRGQTADRIGKIVQNYGEDSAAYEVMPGIAQAGFEEADEAIGTINHQTYDNLKANLRRIK